MFLSFSPSLLSLLLFLLLLLLLEPSTCAITRQQIHSL
jgi:hypothetical protein